jgi:hypothetical protein
MDILVIQDFEPLFKRLATSFRLVGRESYKSVTHLFRVLKLATVTKQTILEIPAQIKRLSKAKNFKHLSKDFKQ